jgi:hypothetical protein
MNITFDLAACDSTLLIKVSKVSNPFRRTSLVPSPGSKIQSDSTYTQQQHKKPIHCGVFDCQQLMAKYAANTMLLQLSEECSAMK